MVLSSAALRRLNTVDIYYKPKEGAVKSLFENADSPVYVVDDSFNITFDAGTKDDIFGNTADLLGKFGPMTKNILQAVSSSLPVEHAFSGALDFRSRFNFTGSSPLSIPVKCVLLNYHGWDTSIAPVLNAIKDWVLPGHVKDAKTGEDYVMFQWATDFVNSSEEEVKARYNGEGDWDTDISSAYHLLVQGFKWVKNWAGDIKLLALPKQLDILQDPVDAKVAHATLRIGTYEGETRLMIPDVFIESVNISIPKTMMINTKHKPEPDHVDITFNIKTFRQLTTSTITF